MTAHRTAVRRVEVTGPDGHRFVSRSSLAAASCVYRDGYRLRLVWGVDLPDGFHYLPGDNTAVTCENTTLGGL